jgi:Uma2 family endonuclease
VHLVSVRVDRDERGRSRAVQRCRCRSVASLARDTPRAIRTPLADAFVAEFARRQAGTTAAVAPLGATMLTVSTAVKRMPTFDELYGEIERLPQGITGQILVAGVLTTMSRPGAPHEHTLAHCGHALDRFDRKFDGNGWWIRQEFEVRFPGDRLAVPDLAGWRSDRYAELPDDNPLRIVPHWCAEILSPSTASDDRTLKLPLYASTGVAHVWLLDPELRTLEVYESIDRRPTLIAAARDVNVVRLPPFDAEFSLGPWWKKRMESTEAIEAAGSRPR